MPATAATLPSRAACTVLSTVRPERRADSRVTSLDRQRAEKKLPHEELCRRAEMSVRSWYQIRMGAWRPRDSTIEKLQRAIDGFEPEPLNIVAAFYRAAMVLLVIECGANPAVVFAQDLSVQRPANADWLQAARLHMIAMYLTTVELEIKNTVMARAIHGTRQNVKQARDKVEDMREADPKIEAMISAVAAQLKGIK